MTQATHAVPEKGVLGHFNWPVTTTSDGRIAATCVTVPPRIERHPAHDPPANTVACPARISTLVLGCTPDEGICGGVYPVSVALYRQGTAAPLARFTTFLTYQEPESRPRTVRTGPSGSPSSCPISGRLSPRPVRLSGTALEPVEGLTGASSAAHRGVAISSAANPVTVTSLAAGGKKGRRSVSQLRSLTATPAGDDQLLAQPYAPSTSLRSPRPAGNEIGAQMARGTALLDAAGLHPPREPGSTRPPTSPPAATTATSATAWWPPRRTT